MTTKEMIEVMQAFEDGKEIECKSKTRFDDIWEQVIPVWNWYELDYRVKQEPKYRPYKDTEEMINDFCTRFGVKRTSYGEPFIWVKDEDGVKRLILKFAKDYVALRGYTVTMQELLENYTYLDGSPCGVRE